MVRIPERSVLSSLTLGGLVVIVLGWIVGGVVADAEVASQIVEALGVLVSAVGRLRLRDLRWPWSPRPPAVGGGGTGTGTGTGSPGAPGGLPPLRRGAGASVGRLIAQAGLALSLLFVLAASPGCASLRDTKYATEEDIDVEYWLGPPCRLIARDGAEVILDVTGPRACRVRVQP